MYLGAEEEGGAPRLLADVSQSQEGGQWGQWGARNYLTPGGTCQGPSSWQGSMIGQQ